MDFTCQCCGACCRIKDGIVRVSDAEIARIATFLGISAESFIANETELAPDRKSLVLRSRPDGTCVYLTDDNLCRINPVKPDKCRSFPLDWANPDSESVCPGLAEARQKALRAELAGADLTPFRRRVYLALLDVPRGHVTTYGALARRIGCRSSQAVGQALKANPFAPRVPCHRVVAADGSLGGFCGARSGAELVRKRQLLESEGVRFTPSGRVAGDLS